MRILHAIYDDRGNPWLGGGGAVRTFEIYRRVAAMGHSVTVVCGRYPGAAKLEHVEGITYRRTGFTRSYIASRVGYAAGAAALIKRGGYDIVVEDFSPFSPVAAPLWVKPGTPVVASVQNLSGSHASRKFGPLGWGPRIAERPLLRLFSNFVAVAPGIASELRKIGGESARIVIIPNGCNPAFREVRRDTASLNGPPYVLSLGRLDPYQKGLDITVRAFDLAAAEMPELILKVAGSGSEAHVAAFRRLLAGAAHRDRIEYLGAVGVERAAELMRDALCLVMPSRYEAWPITAIEAGASGIPVVGSDTVGIRDTAPPFPQAHGFAVPGEDPAGFARAILVLARDPLLRREAGERGRIWANKFSWDTLAAEQIGFYLSLVDNNTAG